MQNGLQNVFYFSLCINAVSTEVVGSNPTASAKVKTLALQGFFCFSITHQCFLRPCILPFCMPPHTFVRPIIHLMQNANAKRNTPARLGRGVILYHPVPIH